MNKCVKMLNLKHSDDFSKEIFIQSLMLANPIFRQVLFLNERRSNNFSSMPFKDFELKEDFDRNGNGSSNLEQKFWTFCLKEPLNILFHRACAKKSPLTIHFSS